MRPAGMPASRFVGLVSRDGAGRTFAPANIRLGTLLPGAEKCARHQARRRVVRPVERSAGRKVDPVANPSSPAPAFAPIPVLGPAPAPALRKS